MYRNNILEKYVLELNKKRYNVLEKIPQKLVFILLLLNLAELINCSCGEAVN